MKQGKGSLFFSDKPPEVSGYLVIGDEEFEIVGWRPSPIRTDISVKQTSEASKAVAGTDHSETSIDILEELRWQKRYAHGRVPYTMERAAKEIERLREGDNHVGSGECENERDTP